MIDTLAHEYGWTVDYIFSMPKAEVMHMVKIINLRYQSQNEAIEGAKDGKNSAPDISQLSPDKLKDFDLEYE